MLTASQHRWIDCAVGMGQDQHTGWLTAHYVFIKKVLGEPRRDALQMAAAFRHVPLDREKCVRVADGWDDDTPAFNEERER